MQRQFDNYIAGEWRGGKQTVANINPSDLSDVIGEFAQAAATDVDDAVEAAGRAQPAWAATGLERRYEVLMAIGRELMDRCHELGELLSREEGKPRAEGVGEVYRSGQFFTYFAAEVLRQHGDAIDSVRDGIEIQVHREPVGVVAVISPWNFPTAPASWKIAPALAFGNAIVWKPANLVPATAWALSEIVARQKLPPGLFNLVMGSGAVAGQRLIESPGIDALSFTGSHDVGRSVATAAAPNFTRLQLELGSKNPFLIMDDADLDLAVECVIVGAYSGTGQKCTASSRLLVHASVHNSFVDKLATAIQGLKVGHALEPDTQIGPVISEEQLHSNLNYLALAKREGCERIAGGRALTLEPKGYYMSPALVIGTTNDMRINREEMFAPIACVQKVTSYEEGLALANDTPFGLTAGIATRSLARAAHFRRQVQTGCVMVNLPTAGTDYHVPFGGRKNSSYGPREQGRAAIEFYTTVKTAYTRPGAVD